MRRSWIVGGGVVAVGALVLISSTSALPGDEHTDEQAEILATAISYPKQDSAAGFARAALATPLGRSPNFAVLEARELPAPRWQDPVALLVIRIHVSEFKSKALFGSDRAAFDACYEMEFNRYGIIDPPPPRVACPEHATPYTPPPAWRMPDGAEDAVQEVLDTLPPRPSAAGVRVALTKRLPHPGKDPATGRNLKPPVVRVRVDDQNVGVLLRAGAGVGIECVLGVRRAGVVHVRSLVSPYAATDDGPYCTPATTP